MNQWLTAQDIAPVIRLAPRYIALVARDQRRSAAERHYSHETHRRVPPMVRKGKPYLIWATTFQRWLQQQTTGKENAHDKNQRFTGWAFR